MRRTVPANDSAEKEVTKELAELAVEFQTGRPVVEPYESPLQVVDQQRLRRISPQHSSESEKPTRMLVSRKLAMTWECSHTTAPTAQPMMMSFSTSQM